MGKLHLAVRFSCANMGNMLHMYTLPLLPKMHYVQPLSVNQLKSLRYQAMNVVSPRLSRAEPPLGREVVEYMLDHDSHMWSMRKRKANFFRLMSVISGLVVLSRWFESMRNWTKPMYSSLFVVTFLLLVALPELITHATLLYMATMGFWQYRYDRLRSVDERIQTVVGDMATQGERFQALFSWRDPRATFFSMIFFLFAAIGFYVVPFKMVVALWGIYALRPLRFRSKLPSPALSFFRRLPTKANSLL
ncbi:hypothetical protein V6N11_010448 [Hibiscus sabdariffa]|uniref:Multiple C2 domain-containing protein n=1 Tax=Hibiscus sabdariffa TaxID=183260 RepID=A0ABR2S659_9ROSI